MKSSGWSSLAISACSALALASVFAAPAGAHVIARTPFVFASASSELELEVPNERDAAMTGLRVTAPPGFRIVGARSEGNWLPRVTPTSVTWTGSSLPPNALTTFELTVDAPATPEGVSFRAAQLYPDGASVRWAVALTVIPAEETQQLGRALVVGLVGLLVLALLGVLLWRRRGAPLQER
jgi:uncharacterized protein YcnI